MKIFFYFQLRTDEKEVCNGYCSRKMSFVPNIIKHNLWVCSFLGDELNVLIEFSGEGFYIRRDKTLLVVVVVFQKHRRYLLYLYLLFIVVVSLQVLSGNLLYPVYSGG